MRVPAEAANGKVKVTLSFADWKEMAIAPAEFELAIEEVSPAQEAKEEQASQSADKDRRDRVLETIPPMIEGLQRQLKDAKDEKTRQEIERLLEQFNKMVEEARKE